MYVVTTGLTTQLTTGFLHMNMIFILGIWKPSEVPAKGIRTGTRPVILTIFFLFRRVSPPSCTAV